MAAIERWMPGGLRVEVLLTGDDTNGAFCLLADQPPPGWGLPPHRHGRESETIYVVEGRFELTVDGERRELGSGEVAHVPAGVLHSGGTLGDEPGRRVVVFSPAGAERIFLDAGSQTPDAAPDFARLVELAAAHGWTFGEE